MPITIRRAVVFPAPLGPRNPKICPGSTVNDRPSRATVYPCRRRSPASSKRPGRCRPCGGRPRARQPARPTRLTPLADSRGASPRGGTCPQPARRPGAPGPGDAGGRRSARPPDAEPIRAAVSAPTRWGASPPPSRPAHPPPQGLSNAYRWRSVTAAIRPLPTPTRTANSLDGPHAAARIVSPDSRNKPADSLIVSSFRYRLAARVFWRKFWMLATVRRAGRPGLLFGAQGGGGFGSFRPAGWQQRAEDRDGQRGQREQGHFGWLVDVHDRCRDAGEGGRAHGADGDGMQDHGGGY